MAESRDIRNAADYVLDLQRRGRYTFTEAEFRIAMGITESAADQALRRLQRRQRVVPLRREFYAVVPIQYVDVGAPPATWFIDGLMRYLGQPYYVGLLTAAGLHGAAHQQAVTFQVVTDRGTRPIRAGGNRVEFHIRRDLETASTVRMQTETGYMAVSGPETTAFDLVSYAMDSGGMSNVATVLYELQERFDAGALATEAALRRTPEVQRLGYLLDELSMSEWSAILRSVASNRRVRPILLQPRERSDAVREVSSPIALSWKVIVNTYVEPDV